jgi:hypothetical protein
MEEVDDEGNPIDPNEARYCLCNRVSFGTMIQCDNVDVSSSLSHETHDCSRRRTGITATRRRAELTMPPIQCEKEWFHLECVGLEEIPARTTKWYCPDCRVLLKIGEKGEVNSRGVKM